MMCQGCGQAEAVRYGYCRECNTFLMEAQETGPTDAEIYDMAQEAHIPFTTFQEVINAYHRQRQRGHHV